MMFVKSYALGSRVLARTGCRRLPAASGIYGVYACTFDARAQTVSLWRLLYLGEAANMQDRVLGHEKWPEWRRHLDLGQELCLNAALIFGNDDRRRAEAAMIRQHEPPCNAAYRDSFPFDMTTVTTSGANALMSSGIHGSPDRERACTDLGRVGGRW